MERGFDDAYRGTPPWEIGRPQPAFEELAASGQVEGSVLDAGCGTGENALLFAAKGHEVWGIDAAPRAIARAQAKAKERGLRATFVVHDALDLGTLGRTFDNVLDCGLLHVFDDEDRRRYEGSLHAALRPGGRYFVLCMRDTGRDWGFGPRRLRREELKATFARGWGLDELREAQFATVDLDPAFGAAWFGAFTRA